MTAETYDAHIGGGGVESKARAIFARDVDPSPVFIDEWALIAHPVNARGRPGLDRGAGPRNSAPRWRDYMSETSAPATSSALRPIVYVVVAAHVAFLAYAIYRIFTAPAGDGTGMNIVGLVPLGVMFLIGVFPAISYTRSGKPLVGLLFALVAFGITQWLWWTMLVNELGIA
jgi:hypothetical protein